MTAYQPISAQDVTGKKLIIRADLNTPMQGGKVSDATRLERLVPGLRALLDKGARIVLISHFGRPKGQKVPEMSLAPVAEALSDCLGRPVAFAGEVIGPVADEAVAALQNGQILVLENLRFHAEEEKNDPEFARQLAQHGDIYVNDAFSAAHRAHASTAALADCLPAFAGDLMDQELSALAKALGEPVRPVAAVVGGAKVSSKLTLLENLIEKVDMLVIGGGMANTFLYAQGYDIGASLCEKEMADTAKAILAKSETAGCRIILPTDVVAADKFAANAPHVTVAIDQIPADKMVLDIGPESCTQVVAALKDCKTLLWNGPFGAFELTPFDAATNAVAAAAADLTDQGSLLTVAGGGDTVAALNQAKVSDRFSYISTAGGAFLEYMEGKALPGVEALKK